MDGGQIREGLELGMLRRNADGKIELTDKGAEALEEAAEQKWGQPHRETPAGLPGDTPADMVFDSKLAAAQEATKDTSTGRIWWYKKCVRDSTVFSGRSRRGEYWVFTLVNMLVLVLLGSANAVISTPDGPNPMLAGLLAFYGLAISVPSLAVSVRRLHDTNRSGWWLLIGLVPFGGLVLLAFFASVGDHGSNGYGPESDTRRSD